MYLGNVRSHEVEHQLGGVVLALLDQVIEVALGEDEESVDVAEVNLVVQDARVRP